MCLRSIPMPGPSSILRPCGCIPPLPHCTAAPLSLVERHDLPKRTGRGRAAPSKTRLLDALQPALGLPWPGHGCPTPPCRPVTMVLA